MPHGGSNGKKKNEESHKDVVLTRGEGIVARRNNKGTQGEEDAEKASVSRSLDLIGGEKEQRMYSGTM